MNEIQCIGIKADGVRCSNNHVQGNPRCGTHVKTFNSVGPNATAVRELKYVQKKILNDLHAEFLVQADQELTFIRKHDLEMDYRNTAAQLRNAHKHQVNLLLRQHRDELIRTGIDPDQPYRERRQQAIAIRHRDRIIRPFVIPVDFVDDDRGALQGAIERARAVQPVHRTALAAFAADNQNVHTSSAVQMTKDMVSKLLQIPVPDGYRWNTSECSKTPGAIILFCKLTPKAAWQMSAKYCQDEQIYEMEKGIYGKVLDCVWQYIMKSPDKEDLFRCLKQEMEDNIGMCAQGNLSRLCNILTGYLDGIGIQESISDILGRLMPKLMDIESLSERLSEAFKILKENNVPVADWKNWLNPLTMDQDDEMEIGFIQNVKEEITGFVAVAV